MRIRPYSSSDRESVLKLSMRAWAPVFEQMRGAVPHFVYANFYPHGWENRQRSDLSRVLDEEPDSCDVLEVKGSVVGWVSTHIHPEDRMGEIHVIAVDPAHQRRGYGSALIRHARARTEEAGMSMVMVETGGDPGHAAGRAAYESAGFRRWPVARYFLEIPDDGPVTSRATVQGPLAAPCDREPSSDPARHDTFHAPVEDQLVAFIDQHRVMLAGSLEGLSEAEARLQLVPSKTTMLGLLKHAIFVERVWFEEAFSGQTRRQLGLVDGPDESFDLAPSDTIPSLLADYQLACQRSRSAVRGLSSDHIVSGNRRGPLTLRWIQLHVLRELAQHCGHAEILREQILARRAQPLEDQAAT